MASPIVIGDTLQIYLTAATLAGVAADPSGLTLRVRAPDGTVTDYPYGTSADVIKDAVGSYHADIPAATAGTWRWRWEVTGSVPGVSEGDVMVQGSKVI